MERALSYTLGHKPGESCCRVDERGRVLNDVGEVPAVVHQYSKGAAGRKLQRTAVQGCACLASADEQSWT